MAAHSNLIEEEHKSVVALSSSHRPPTEHMASPGLFYGSAENLNLIDESSAKEDTVADQAEFKPRIDCLSEYNVEEEP